MLHKAFCRGRRKHGTCGFVDPRKWDRKGKLSNQRVVELDLRKEIESQPDFLFAVTQRITFQMPIFTTPDMPQKFLRFR
jgi:hypothetical protein